MYTHIYVYIYTIYETCRFLTKENWRLDCHGRYQPLVVEIFHGALICELFFVGWYSAWQKGDSQSKVCFQRIPKFGNPGVDASHSLCHFSVHLNVQCPHGPGGLVSKEMSRCSVTQMDPHLLEKVLSIGNCPLPRLPGGYLKRTVVFCTWDDRPTQFARPQRIVSWIHWLLSARCQVSVSIFKFSGIQVTIFPTKHHQTAYDNVSILWKNISCQLTSDPGYISCIILYETSVFAGFCDDQSLTAVFFRSGGHRCGGVLSNCGRNARYQGTGHLFGPAPQLRYVLPRWPRWWSMQH